MRILSLPLVAAGLLVSLCGCANTALKQTWKSPEAQGPVKKIAVLAVDERRDVRMAIENRFVRELRRVDHEAVATRDLLALREIKDDKAAAAARLREAGSDAVLIVRLVDQATYQNEVVTMPVLHSPGLYGTYDWYDTFSYAFGAMGSVSMTASRQLYFDSSLFDLASGHRLWSGVTSTKLLENADALVEADAIAEKVAKALRKDGMVK
jgi:hypothetical protein